MSLNPIIKNTLERGVLGGNSFVAETPGAGRPIHEWGYGHDQEHQRKLQSDWYKWSREHPEVGLMGPHEFEQWKKEQGIPPTEIIPIGLGGPKTEVAGIFSPFNPKNWFGTNQSVGEQVKQGTYNPEEPSASPTDTFLRGTSNRNRQLQQLMDEAGW